MQASDRLRRLASSVQVLEAYDHFDATVPEWQMQCAALDAVTEDILVLGPAIPPPLRVRIRALIKRLEDAGWMRD